MSSLINSKVVLAILLILAFVVGVYLKDIVLLALGVIALVILAFKYHDERKGNIQSNSYDKKDLDHSSENSKQD